MKTHILSTLSLGTLLLFSTSCSKYEEGPKISLIPRSERVANHWVIDKATEKDEDVTEDYEQYDLLLTKDGDATLKANYKVLGATVVTTTNGTWEFTNDDKNIKFDYEDDDADGEYQILKLTQKQLWMREIGGDVELHLEGL